MTTLQGGPELLAFLDSLPAKLEQNILRGALRAGAKVVAEDAKQRASYLRTPARGSAPSESVSDKIYVTSRAKNGEIAASVKLKGFAASVGIWAEFGTAAHWISIDPQDRTTKKGVISIRTTNRNAREGGSLVIGGHFVGPSVYHPGAAAHPFMTPALDSSASAAVAAAADYIKGRLEGQGLNSPDFGVGDEGEDA